MSEHTLASMADLYVPEMHFYHADKLASYRDMFVRTGNPFYLTCMLDCVVYAATKPAAEEYDVYTSHEAEAAGEARIGTVYLKWSNEDTWNDSHVFGLAF